MKTAFITILLITTTIYNTFAQSQPDMDLEDSNGDGSTFYALALGKPNGQDYKRMLFGLNQSSDGWLRMVTNNDLSFWTHNKMRMTITNDGDIGVRTTNPLTEFFIANGRLGLETKSQQVQEGIITFDSEQTGIDFYTGNNQIGGLNYKHVFSPTQNFTPEMTLENLNNGVINIATNGSNRIIVGNTGTVRLPTLAGNGTRNLVVNSNGTIQAGNTTSPESKHKVVSPTHFQNDPFSAGDLRYATFGLFSGFDNFTAGPVFAVAHPEIPNTKYTVNEIEVFFEDNSASEDIGFRVLGATTDELTFESSGQSNTTRSVIQNPNFVIDQSLGDELFICVEFRDDDFHVFKKAVITYTPIFD